jgi:hypothetical protein
MTSALQRGAAGAGAVTQDQKSDGRVNAPSLWRFGPTILGYRVACQTGDMQGGRSVSERDPFSASRDDTVSKGVRSK